MGANSELEFLCQEHSGPPVFFANSGTRMAAIIESLAIASPFQESPAVAMRWATVELNRTELNRVDPETAAFVWHQLADATQLDDGLWMSVVAADRIAFRVLIDTTPEAPHAP